MFKIHHVQLCSVRDSFITLSRKEYKIKANRFVDVKFIRLQVKCVIDLLIVKSAISAINLLCINLLCINLLYSTFSSGQLHCIGYHHLEICFNINTTYHCFCELEVSFTFRCILRKGYSIVTIYGDF